MVPRGLGLGGVPPRISSPPKTLQGGRPLVGLGFGGTLLYIKACILEVLYMFSLERGSNPRLENLQQLEGALAVH